MKQFIAMVLTFCMCLCLCSCGSGKKSEEELKAELKEEIMQELEREEKQESAMEKPPAEETPEPPTETPPAENGIRPELKEFLDSYEAFTDEYVKFMQNYANTDNVLVMMTQYAEIMGRYADFAETIDEYDKLRGEMSNAELAYYIDVTSRCSQKMLLAAGNMAG